METRTDGSNKRISISRLSRMAIRLCFPANSNTALSPLREPATSVNVGEDAALSTRFFEFPNSYMMSCIRNIRVLCILFL